MKHSAMTVGMLMIGLAVAATAGCGPDVPANPDWAIDVRPILQARCVRCHSSPARMDPLSKDQVGALSFDSDASTPLVPALMSMIPGRVKGGPPSIMPPPPNAPLEDWQIQILSNYAKNHPL